MQASSSSKASGDRQMTQTGRMRNRKKSGAELYKTRHNIGKRSAAGRVTSYRETEVALLFPDGFFRPVVKVEMTENEKEDVACVDNTGGQDLSKADHVTGEVKPKRLSSESSESVKKRSPKSWSSSAQNKPKGPHKGAAKTIVKKKSTLKRASVERKTGDEKNKAAKESAFDKETKTVKERGKVVKGSLKSVKNSQNEVSPSKIPDASNQHTDSDSSSSSLQVRLPKDTTSDNKKSDPATKKGEIESKNKNTVKKNKGANHSSVISSAKSSKYFGLQPRAPRIKRTACLNAGAIMSAMYKDTPVVKKPKMDMSSVHATSEKSISKQSPKKQETSKSESPKKVVGSKKAECKQNYALSKKVPHLDINKKVKVKMKAKEKVKPRPRIIKRGKKVKVEDSSEEDSETEEEEHIPLWPPPRRMASLNAQVSICPIPRSTYVYAIINWFNQK